MLDRLAEITGDLPVTGVSPNLAPGQDWPLIDSFAERSPAAARAHFDTNGG